MNSLFNYQRFFGVCVKLNKCMIAEFMKKSVKAFLALQSKFFSEFMLQLATSSVKLSLIVPLIDIWEEQTYIYDLCQSMHLTQNVWPYDQTEPQLPVC